MTLVTQARDIATNGPVILSEFDLAVSAGSMQSRQLHELQRKDITVTSRRQPSALRGDVILNGIHPAKDLTSAESGDAVEKIALKSPMAVPC